MKAMQSNSSNANLLVNWRDFCLGYISAACACADAYLNHNQNVSGFKSYGKFAFIPAFWNFKHALELGIKFLFNVRDSKSWGHDLINNLEKYKKERNLSDKECKDLKEMCRKYINLVPLQKLKDVQDKNFVSLSDRENQFFHYPEGNDRAHKTAYDLNQHFAYYSLEISQPSLDNEKVMREIMEELKKDAFFFAKILGEHTN